MSRYARIHLKGTPDKWVDWPLPGEVTLANFVHGIHLQGCIMPAEIPVYIAFDQIKMIVEIGNNLQKPMAVFGGLVPDSKPN
jgi:hypothetical protein